jgi:hypothetical protein
MLLAVEFEWDPEKDRANQKKHGVSFAEASTNVRWNGSPKTVSQNRMNEDRMSQQTSESEEDDIPEMDLSGGVRGKYYEAYQRGTNVVLLEPDLATVFRDSDAVNQALRQFLSEHGAPPPTPKHSD